MVPGSKDLTFLYLLHYCLYYLLSLTIKYCASIPFCLLQMDPGPGGITPAACAFARWLPGVFRLPQLCGSIQLGVPPWTGQQWVATWSHGARHSTKPAIPTGRHPHQRCGNQQVSGLVVIFIANHRHTANMHCAHGVYVDGLTQNFGNACALEWSYWNLALNHRYCILLNESLSSVAIVFRLWHWKAAFISLFPACHCYLAIVNDALCFMEICLTYACT